MTQAKLLLFIAVICQFLQLQKADLIWNTYKKTHSHAHKLMKFEIIGTFDNHYVQMLEGATEANKIVGPLLAISILECINKRTDL